MRSAIIIAGYIVATAIKPDFELSLPYWIIAVVLGAHDVIELNKDSKK